MRTPRLAALTAAGTLTLALALTGCGSDSDKDSGAGNDPTATFTSVTIEHKFGKTEITSEPKRIVTVGLTDQDAVLALGKVPVATTNWFGDAPGRVFPWAESKLNGAELPQVLDTEKEFEKVAALQPDLITAVYAGITKADYDKLSKIAPVVAAPTGYVDYGTPWQEQTTIIGKAMGQSEKAATLVADIEGQLAKAKADHPEFAGKTAATVSAYEGIFIYGPEDPRGRFLTDIGFTYPENLKKFAKENFGESISPENAEEVNLDALVWVNDAEATNKMVPTYKNLRVSKEGRSVFIAETDDLYIPSSFVTVLSIPYLIEKEVPRLSAAVDGDPATKSD
jgi:iron-siderophore transport system substrate-binding protein